MEGLETEVALIVKAPNQQTDDVRIHAIATWSVRELKAHLADVYPTKPKTDEQKIIYSGQLLEDNVILKDVLRVYEGQDGHTVHLVCAAKRYAGGSAPPVGADAADGLRRRNTAGGPGAGSDQEVPLRPETRQNDQNHTVEYQSYFSHLPEGGGRVPAPHADYSGYVTGAYPLPTDPVALANHIAMMQDAYLRYMQHYADMWQRAGMNVPGVQPVNVANEPVQQPAVAPAEPAEDEAAAPPDWLDWLYVTSRLAILFSLLYFYSSPFRLLLVMLLAVVGYLYQLGFFREVGFDIRPNEQPARNEPRNDQPNAVRAENGNGTENAEASPDTPNVTTNENTNQQSYLAAIWMIFTSFFTSLIPDTPNVV